MAITPTDLRIFNARNALKKLGQEALYYTILANEFGLTSMKELSEEQKPEFATSLENQALRLLEEKEEKEKQQA